MSLASTRLSLIHRCTVNRDANAATSDSWGQTDKPNWQPHLTDLACRAWSASGREVIADKTSIVVDDDIRLLVPSGTDVTERDQIGDITYRGATIFPGPIGIRAVNYRRDHLELVLVRITG